MRQRIIRGQDIIGIQDPNLITHRHLDALVDGIVQVNNKDLPRLKRCKPLQTTGDIEFSILHENTTFKVAIARSYQNVV